MHQPFNLSTLSIKWRHNQKEIEAWKNGKTGFPLIDAAMLQLKYEGWMHNRLRMVVAMFFTKNLLHDWRLGEAFFMENLIDGDLPLTTVAGNGVLLLVQMQLHILEFLTQ